MVAWIGGRGRCGLGVLGAMMMASTSTAALGQETPPAETRTSAGREDHGDIVVTARRTKERLQTVPMSISALSSAQLANSGINSLADSVSVIPNVAMSGGIAGVLQGQLSVRGISTLVRNPGVEAGVGIYVDGVFMGLTIRS